jgi:iron complex transport system permease protein
VRARTPLTLLVLAGLAALVLTVLVTVTIGPADLGVAEVARSIAGHLGLPVEGVPRLHDAIVWDLRLPRVLTAAAVGAGLALAGAVMQSLTRNPLADPYLLGVAAGAGLGATAAIAGQHAFGALAAAGGNGTPLPVPVAAFAGALLAVALTYAVGAAGSRYRTPATLILAGVAVSSFLTAGQVYLQQRYVDTIREVYSWLMGRLEVAGWHDVLLLLPYALVTGVVILSQGRRLDVLSVGDEEAESLGAHPRRTRYLLIVAASMGTAAAVSVSGLIPFVGLIVPHTVRLLAGSSYRVILPLSMLFGGAFLTLADLAARTALPPTEIPIGVVTAFLGAPFFVVVLRTGRRVE